MNAMKNSFDLVTNNRNELNMPPQPQDATGTAGEGAETEGVGAGYTEDML